MTKNLPVFNFLRSFFNGPFNIEASTGFLCAGLFSFPAKYFFCYSKKTTMDPRIYCFKAQNPN